MTVTDEMAVLGTGNNYSLFLKKLFLSFAQALFSDHGKYTWKANTAQTGIIICDKYAVDFALLEKKPGIVLERGSFNWMQTSMGQRLSQNLMSGSEVYTDLIRGSIRFNCIAKSGLVSEELAVILLQSLTGFKKQIKEKGIHQILDISIGEETLVKSDSEVELTVVPVIVVYTSQKMLSYTKDFYSVYVTLTQDDTTSILVENSDYWVRQNLITLYSAPADGSIINVIYLDASTLTEATETPIPAPDGTITEFYLSGSVYGYGPILEHIYGFALISGIETDWYYHDSVSLVSGLFDV